MVIPGNVVDLQLSARSESQLPFAKVELVASRGPWLGEPLAAAAIGWVTALTATALPERQPYPALYQALGGALDAICHAPSARGWAEALVGYEVLLLRELGYGGADSRPEGGLVAGSGSDGRAGGSAGSLPACRPARRRYGRAPTLAGIAGTDRLT